MRADETTPVTEVEAFFLLATVGVTLEEELGAAEMVPAEGVILAWFWPEHPARATIATAKKVRTTLRLRTVFTRYKKNHSLYKLDELAVAQKLASTIAF